MTRDDVRLMVVGPNPEMDAADIRCRAPRGAEGDFDAGAAQSLEGSKEQAKADGARGHPL